jgi:hypothetical protein
MPTKNIKTGRSGDGEARLEGAVKRLAGEGPESLSIERVLLQKGSELHPE